ncbi:glycosyltransferase [Humisphaera borealis]|uniref:Glycosyltransferase n=1 Tax=Humisphaera borealis TaxID=2807512 RepID=A0A7M2WYU1_9BACT|nr:glycosyltransferase family 2 protein [Humisphaera borealis]QOV90563.1 glycosyltransferase [Humisphaera borealis]
MTITLIILGLIALVWIGLYLSPVHRSTFTEPLDADAGEGALDGTQPPVTLIAPARNESAVLPRTVPTYCRQEYTRLRVLIVDDQSDDTTPTVLTELSRVHPELIHMRTTERPAGWMGKSWAVASGVTFARGLPSVALDTTPEQAAEEIYCFTDADCAFHPRALATAVRVMREQNADMLSVLPHMVLGHWSEKIGLPALLTTLGMVFPLGSVNNPASSIALAAGGFILIRRSAYEKVGGHESVRSHIVEDVQLARRAKSMGVRLHTRLTRNLVTTHMYEDWNDLWEGLAKNAYAGMDYQPRKFWVGLIVGMMVAVLPPVYMVATLIWVIAAPSPAGWTALALSAAIVAAQAAIHARTIRHMGLPLYHAVLMPVSIALYQAIAASSAFQYHYRGGNLWKGRRVGGPAVTEPQPPG